MSRRPKSGSALVRLSVSATDEEWTAVSGQAALRNLSISRYLVGTALANPSAPKAGPAPAPDDGDERRLLEVVRRLRPLLLEPDDPGSPPPVMPEWLRTVIEAWVSVLAGSGRAGEVYAILAAVPGEEGLDRAAAAHAAETQATAASNKPKQSRKRATSGPAPGQQGALF
ncbi:MAG: hypothetical protein F4Y03_12650 [Alphaproteobacteria bacterium]|nr:hypothetical protein [Alphaproteobacteria bacterium]